MNRILVVEDDEPLRHLLCQVVGIAGFSVAGVGDGRDALELLRSEPFDLVLLDVWVPRLSGLEILSTLRSEGAQPKAIVMTADDTPETVLRAVKEQAYQYVVKPFSMAALIELIHKALQTAPAPRPIEVLSARPNWVELLVPCELDAADRIQSFLTRLDADLPTEVRDAVGQAFRELLVNAIEWGGELDPNRRVRIAYLRGRHMILYRIADPGKGFQFDGMKHAAIAYPSDQPSAHMKEREKAGLRPGGFGILVAKAMVDELIYNEAQNEVVFIKYTEPPKG